MPPILPCSPAMVRSSDPHGQREKTEMIDQQWLRFVFRMAMLGQSRQKHGEAVSARIDSYLKDVFLPAGENGAVAARAAACIAAPDCSY